MEQDAISPLELPETLAALVPPDLLDAERLRWVGLSASQRARATARLKALERWNHGKGEIDAAAAAQIAEMKINRFYRVAAAWRDAPSLAALGVFVRPDARKPKISPDVLEKLAAAARKATLLYGDISLSALVARTVAFARLPANELPGTTKLREIVGTERRRLNANKALGQVILFDCVATSMPRDDGRPHIAFLCMDETGAVLGVSVGLIDAVVSGYAAAASDALRRIEEHAADWPWSNAFSIVRFTAGEDIERIARLTHRLNVMFKQRNFILERGGKRYGRLIGKTIGPRLGRVLFTPTRTIEGLALATNGDMTPWSGDEAYYALRMGADDNNAQTIAMPESGSVQPPPQMIDALVSISGERG